MGLTTKQICFADMQRRFGVRHDRIVASDPCEDGFGIMRNAQTANPKHSAPATAGSRTT